MDSLNTSRPRSSRPRTGVDQLIKSTRSDMPNPLLLAARQVTGPVVATVSDRVRHGFCMGWWRVALALPPGSKRAGDRAGDARVGRHGGADADNLATTASRGVSERVPTLSRGARRSPATRRADGDG